jgi:putative endonuclease
LSSFAQRRICFCLCLSSELPCRAVTEHLYYVYILASRSRTLYVGVTNYLKRRVMEHREGKEGFTARYKIHRLVHFEQFAYINNAIAREKVLKHCTRAEKIALIEAANSTWEDLAAPELGAYPGGQADPPLREG